MDFKLTEEERAKKAEFDEFFKQEMKNAPVDESGGLEGIYGSDEGWAFHRYMMKEIAKRKWNVMAWPKEYGGYEASVMEQLLFSESMAYHRAPGIDGFGVRMFAPTLILFATEEQKKRLLPPIANADVHYCQGWSEPNAGSDLASLTTQAIRQNDHYIVNGQKIWTTGAHRADHMFMLARTDPNSKRSAGLSVFNIDMSWPGIEVRPIKYMNGAHIYNEVYFTDVKVPVEDRIGPENEGWRLTRQTMNFERSSAAVYAGMRRTFEELLDYLKNTVRDGKPLSEHPSVRDRLARLYIDLEIGRALSYKVAWLQHQGNLIFSPAAASEAKVFSSELRSRLVSMATEMFGLYGQVEASEWAPLNGAMIDGYQLTIGSTICAGSNEIQRNLIAWVGLELPRFK